MKQIVETTDSCRKCLFIADPENFCYKIDKYLNNDIDTVHPDCPLPDTEPEVCEWKQDEDGVYFTQCGEGFYFDNGTKIGETNFKFCPYCQKTIKVKE